MARDSMSASSEQSSEPEEDIEMDVQPSASEVRVLSTALMPAVPDHDSAAPFRRRYQLTMADNKLTITATLIAPSEVDKLIRLLEANKALLDGFDVEDSPPN